MCAWLSLLQLLIGIFICLMVFDDGVCVMLGCSSFQILSGKLTKFGRKNVGVFLVIDGCVSYVRCKRWEWKIVTFRLGDER